MERKRSIEENSRDVDTGEVQLKKKKVRSRIKRGISSFLPFIADSIVGGGARLFSLGAGSPSNCEK